jgi:NAD(P)-dependent dehydrogenase (short-subunit alcohol dehydrogenase family)
MRVLITGAARAIGAATAQELSARGHEVVATARNLEGLPPVQDVRWLRLDVTDTDSIAAALDQAGELDAVVNNAAVTAQGPLEAFPLDKLQELFDTNCLGPLRLLQAVAPPWRARRSGVIVNVSSIQGRVSIPLGGPYAASKYALEALSESMHYELAHFGVRTVIIEPGYVAPGMKSSPRYLGPSDYADLWDQWSGVESTLSGPVGRPDAELVAVAIAEAIEDPTTPLRVRVGQDAELVLSAREQLTDLEFESAMRSTLGLSW